MRYDVELYRWLMPLVLHASFYHILVSSALLIREGKHGDAAHYWLLGGELDRPAQSKSLEQVNGWQTMTIYIVGGVGGILFSSLCTHNMSVGSSFALFAIVGALVSFY